MIRGSSASLSILVLWTIAVGRRGGCEAYSFLFRSKETFKLAEIQNLEAVLQTRECSFEEKFRCDLHRLLVDRATGSSLFRLDLQQTNDVSSSSSSFASNDDDDDDIVLSPESRSMIQSRLLSLSSLQRCDWIGEILHEGCDAAELVENLKISQNTVDNLEEWNLDYVKLVGDTSSKQKQKQGYTMKSLLCSVAHELPSRPSLNPALAKDTLLVVDTTTKAHETNNDDSSSCFLVRCLDHPTHKRVLRELEWANRPFQYSSAINTEVAEMVMELLLTLCQTNNNTKRNVLLDPTCGSGTFLALAMANGLSVEGCDINPSVVDGAIRNLEYAFGEERVKEFARVETHDSCDERQSGAESVSCVVANLPWGRNSVLYVDENKRILRSVRSQIKAGIPCAFITRPSEKDKGPLLLFESNGFEVLGQAFVPQRDFLLPPSKKKKKTTTTEDDEVGSRPAWNQNQCVITVALAKHNA